MDKKKFEKAIELKKEIEEYKRHKQELESSNIQYGGGLIFKYNSMKNEIPLKHDLFGGNRFFKSYMDALNNMIETLQKEFDEL
jgi:hypothetical protein